MVDTGYDLLAAFGDVYPADKGSDVAVETLKCFGFGLKVVCVEKVDHILHGLGDRVFLGENPQTQIVLRTRVGAIVSAFPIGPHAHVFKTGRPIRINLKKGFCEMLKCPAFRSPCYRRSFELVQQLPKSSHK